MPAEPIERPATQAPNAWPDGRCVEVTAPGYGLAPTQSAIPGLSAACIDDPLPIALTPLGALSAWLTQTGAPEALHEALAGLEPRTCEWADRGYLNGDRLYEGACGGTGPDAWDDFCGHCGGRITLRSEAPHA